MKKNILVICLSVASAISSIGFYKYYTECKAEGDQITSLNITVYNLEGDLKNLNEKIESLTDEKEALETNANKVQHFNNANFSSSGRRDVIYWNGNEY